MGQRKPYRRRRVDLPGRVLRCAGDPRHLRAGAADAVRGRRAGRAGPHQRAVCAGVRGPGRIRRRWPELLDRAPLGPATAAALAVLALPAMAGPWRVDVPPPRRQEHRDRALRRRGAAVRAGDRRHAAHAAASLCAAQPGRVRWRGRRCSSPRAGCWARPTTRSPRSPTGWRWCWLSLLAAIALVWAGVLYTWRWFAAHADSLLARALALDPRASAPGPVRRRADRPEPAGIAVAGDAGGVPAGDQLGLVLVAGDAAGQRRPAGAGPQHPRVHVGPAQPARRPDDGRRWPASAMPRCSARPLRSRWATCCGGGAGWRRRTGWRRWCSAWR